MNFLAHMYLSCSEESLIVGNFLGDFLNKKEADQLVEPFDRGILLHRRIDTFTDQHPAVREVNKRFHKIHHKYAPVVTDILFDYVLAQKWDRYSGQSLKSFCSEIYRVLLKHENLFPERRKRGIMAMINGGFLEKYTHLDGLRFTFKKMDQRSRYNGRFSEATTDLNDHLPYLEKAFDAFFPELIEEVDGFCAC